MPLEIYLNQILLIEIHSRLQLQKHSNLVPAGSVLTWKTWFVFRVRVIWVHRRVVHEKTSRGHWARNISCGLGNRQVRLGVFPYNVIELFRGGWNRWTFYGIRDLFKLRSRASKSKLTSQLLYISSSPVQCPGQLRVWPVNTAVAEYPRGGRVHDPR